MNTQKRTNAGAIRSAISSERRIPRVLTTGRAIARPVVVDAPTLLAKRCLFLLLLRCLGDLVDHLLRSGLARELVRDRGVERVADVRSERDVEIELDERRLRAVPENRAQVRVGNGVLRSLPYRQTEARRADPALDARAVEVAHELGTRRLRRLPRAREAVAATEHRARQRLAARDVREREPAQEARDLVVRGEALGDASLPVTLQLHRDLAVGEEASRA